MDRFKLVYMLEMLLILMGEHFCEIKLGHFELLLFFISWSNPLWILISMVVVNKNAHT